MEKLRLRVTARESSEAQRAGLIAQIENTRKALLEAGHTEFGSPVMVVGSVFGAEWKNAIREAAKDVKAGGGDGFAAEVKSRAVRIPGFSTQHPERQPRKQDWDALYELSLGLIWWFPLGMGASYEEEHSFQVKRGLISRKQRERGSYKVKREVLRMKVLQMFFGEGKSRKQISREIGEFSTQEGVSVSLRTIRRWIDEEIGKREGS